MEGETALPFSPTPCIERSFAGSCSHRQAQQHGCVRRSSSSCTCLAQRLGPALDLCCEENSELVKQNNASDTRASRKSTVVGKVKVMSYEDIEKEIQRREEKEAAEGSHRGRKRKNSGSKSGEKQELCAREIEAARREFGREEYESCCSVS